MADLNKVMLIGRLAKEPELRYTPSGMQVCSFTLAVNGGTKENPDTYFAECTIFGKFAEILQKSAGKGSQLYVEGRLHLDTWEDRQSGAKRQRTTITVSSIQFLDRKQEYQQPEAPSPYYQERQPRYQGRYREDVPPPMPPPPMEGVEEIVDDLPF